MPDLTPDRIREALLLLQAVDEASEPISVERIKDGWLVGTSTPTHPDGFWVGSNTLTEALTGLLDALGAEPWAWPSPEEVRVFRSQFNADEDDLLRVLAGYFATEPRMVLALLATDAGRAA